MLGPISISNGDGPIASTSSQPYSSSIRASTSVKMSDGSIHPFSWRATSFSRFGGGGGPVGLATPGFGPSSVSMMQPSPQFGPSSISHNYTLSPGGGPSSMVLDGGFSLSPMAGFHPASYKGPGSFGASHLANMESSFCKNFVCCGLELDDLHGLLEHFEERHCQAGEIVGIEGFDGVTLGEMAEGVGISKELGVGPGMGNVPRPSRGEALGPGNGTFEGEEEWSSEGTQSGPPSPQASQQTQGGKPQSNLAAQLQKSSPTSTPSPPEQQRNQGGINPSGTVGGQRVAPKYRDAMLSAMSTPASSLPGSPHDGTDEYDEMDDMELDLGTGGPAQTHRPPGSNVSAATTAGAAGTTGAADLASLMSTFSVGGPFNVGGLSNGAAQVMGGVGVPPSFLQGDGNPSAGLFGANAFQPQQSTGADPSQISGQAVDSSDASISAATAAALAAAAAKLPPGVSLDPSMLNQQRPPQKKRTNLDPVTGLTPTGRQPRPWVPPSEKPFKCTVPGCDKAYKQQNGLKYHRTHGHCNQKGLTPEEEAKPFVCHHDVCGKRYKNMNGLRYHYQHSGQHGTIGIQLLSLGAHPPPQYPAGHKKSAQNTPQGSRASSPTRGLGGSPLGPNNTASNGATAAQRTSPAVPQTGTFAATTSPSVAQQGFPQAQPFAPAQTSPLVAQPPQMGGFK